MYGYNAEQPIAIPIYTVLPYCVISTRKPSKCTDLTNYTNYNAPCSLQMVVATARSSRYTRVATVYDLHSTLE